MEVVDRHVKVAEINQVGECRRLAIDIGRSSGFGETDLGRVAITVTEAATNLVKHAAGGEILLHASGDGEGAGLWIVALDRGPGIPDVARARGDGFSTSGTSGTGLGAIARQSDEFDIHSMEGVGTAVVAHVSVGRGRPTARGTRVGGVSVPMPGEDVCGDGWAVFRDERRDLVLVTDGLGHGRDAAAASARAMEVFLAHGLEAPAEIVARIHEALRATRGAAVAVAELDRARRVIRYSGIGNVAGTVLNDGTTRSLVSHHGTLGHGVRKIAEFQYPWPETALLVLNSDGLVSGWTLSRYPGLERRHPVLVAAVLYRDFQRGRDDTTVVVARGDT
jgi:anti-sigma regulatory factor (Ser/Thr protein kinase)